MKLLKYLSTSKTRDFDYSNAHNVSMNTNYLFANWLYNSLSVIIKISSPYRPQKSLFSLIKFTFYLS